MSKVSSISGETSLQTCSVTKEDCTEGIKSVAGISVYDQLKGEQCGVVLCGITTDDAVWFQIELDANDRGDKVREMIRDGAMTDVYLSKHYKVKRDDEAYCEFSKFGAVFFSESSAECSEQKQKHT